MEEWRDIEGYEGIYQVSDRGQVRRICGPSNCLDDTRTLERILSPKLAGKSYKEVSLCWRGRKYYASIHRLVAQAFLPNPLDLPEVDHIDGDKVNNRVENLEWVTRYERCSRDGRRGVLTRALSKLTEAEVLEIRELYGRGEHTQREIGTMFGVSASAIGNLVRFEAWVSLSDRSDYDDGETQRATA